MMLSVDVPNPMLKLYEIKGCNKPYGSKEMSSLYIDFYHKCIRGIPKTLTLAFIP